MRRTHFLSAIRLSLAVSFALGSCGPTAPGSRGQGNVGEISPSWSTSAYRNQDREDAWHFAYAVQSWAGEQSGHVVMIPARYTIVADRAFFSDEFSHIPLRALRGVHADDPNRVVVLKHMWTQHASSWDYDTDIKLVLYGPGFIKEGVKLQRTTLQNIAPTYARMIGTTPPKGSMGRVMSEALVPTTKRPKVILTIVFDGGGRSLYEAWPDAWPVIRGLAARGVEYMDTKVTQLETATAVSHTAIGTDRHELSGARRDRNGRPRGRLSPRQQEPHRRPVRQAEEAGMEGGVPRQRSGQPFDDKHRPFYLPRVPPGSKPIAVREGVDGTFALRQPTSSSSATTCC